MAGRMRRGIQLVVDGLLYVALSTIYLVLNKAIPPVRGGFFCDDRSIQKPYVGDTVTLFHLILCGQGFAIVVIFIVEVLQSRAQGSGIREYCIRALRASIVPICLLHYGLVVAMIFAEVGKHSVGKLRPHFMATCQPDLLSINCSEGYIEVYNCTNVNVHLEQVLDAYKSFPSGHAAYGAYIAVFMLFFFHHRVTTGITIMLKFVLQALVVSLALFGGFSRVQDNRHHPEDVLAGFLVGALVAVWTVWSYGDRMFKSTKMTSKESPDSKVEMEEQRKITCERP